MAATKRKSVYKKRSSVPKRKKLSKRARSFKAASKFYPGEMKVLMSQSTDVLDELVRLCKKRRLPATFCGRKKNYKQKKPKRTSM